MLGPQRIMLHRMTGRWETPNSGSFESSHFPVWAAAHWEASFDAQPVFRGESNPRTVICNSPEAVYPRPFGDPSLRGRCGLRRITPLAPLYGKKGRVT